jgi:hypothetical protein
MGWLVQQASGAVPHLSDLISMKIRTVLLVVMALVPLMVLGRLIKISDPKTLIADSKLVFVGRVKSVKPSNIRTSLSYAPWKEVAFQWLVAEVEVIEPFKGVQKGDIVRTAMLSVDKQSRSQPMYSPPGMLEPEKNDIFFLCLAPTPQANVFAALSAPYDENLSVFPIHRSRSTKGEPRDSTKRLLLSKDERFAMIWSLVNETGELLPASADKLRETYAAEIGKSPSIKVICLQWETYTNPSGWMSDVPKGYVAMTNANGK